MGVLSQLTFVLLVPACGLFYLQQTDPERYGAVLRSLREALLTSTGFDLASLLHVPPEQPADQAEPGDATAAAFVGSKKPTGQKNPKKPKGKKAKQAAPAAEAPQPEPEPEPEPEPAQAEQDSDAASPPEQLVDDDGWTLVEGQDEGWETATYRKERRTAASSSDAPGAAASTNFSGAPKPAASDGLTKKQRENRRRAEKKRAAKEAVEAARKAKGSGRSGGTFTAAGKSFASATR